MFNNVLALEHWYCMSLYMFAFLDIYYNIYLLFWFCMPYETLEHMHRGGLSLLGMGQGFLDINIGYSSPIKTIVLF
jgi:hypothetical protein